MRRFIYLSITILLLSLFACANAESLFYIGSYEGEKSNGMWNSDHTMLEKPIATYDDLSTYTREQIDSAIDSLYKKGYTEDEIFWDLESGWSDDESLYVSYGDIEIGISEAYANTGSYRVAVFYESNTAGLCASYGFINTKSEPDYYNHNDSHYVQISNQVGLYKNITVVVTGNGMVSTKTFDVQVVEYPWGYSNNNEYAYGLAHGDSYSTEYPQLATSYVPYDYHGQPSIPKNDFMISWPVEGSVHSGYDAAMIFSDDISIYTSKDRKEPGNVTASLTHLATGKVIFNQQNTSWNWSESDNFKEFGLIFSDSSPLLHAGWESGEYRLTVEVEGMGSHYVDIMLENSEMDPAEYFKPFTADKLRLLFGSDPHYFSNEYQGVWNADYSVFTASIYGDITVRVSGLDPSEKYVCALFYTDASGKDAYVIEYVTESEYDYLTFTISSKAGSYENLTLILTGNGETIIHPFTCIVPSDTSDERYGVVFGASYSGVNETHTENVFSIYEDYKKKLSLQPKYTETGVIRYSENSILPEINAYFAGMNLIETDIYQTFIRYANSSGSDSLLPSFAILSPNVAAEQVENDLANPVHTANWAVREAYAFQQNDAFMYTEEDFIDIDPLNAFFANQWVDLCALEFAAGTAEDLTGAVYNWMPVYYDDGQGGFHQDKLYLFIYISYPGADSEYLAPFNYYNPLFYEEYHTVKLMITDQTHVYEIMNKLRSLNTAFEHMVDTTRYVHLKEGASGEYVRRLQVRLTELGYLTSSVDGVYTPPVTEAVKAYQADHGLEATGTANAELQKMILDPTYEKQLLLTWLENHNESKGSDKE